MNNYFVKKIVLFTLSACPIGKSMGTVLRELAALFPELNFETVYVEIQPEEANHYRIKTNPTTLFIDENSRQLYRLEGFHETNVVKDIIEKINQNKIELALEELAENKETVEKYVLYLLRNGDFMPVEVYNNNRTSIKAPRITVITLLLQSTKEGYINPFPSGTTLELVQFHDTTGIIALKLTNDVDATTIQAMKTALQKTLSQYGIKQVELDLRR